MAWRLTRLVQAGEIDNTTRGWTTGWLELTGFPGRLQLKLEGNCSPDLAGWKFLIHRTEPEPIEESRPEEALAKADETENVKLMQTGSVGKLTADEMIKHFQLSPREVALRLRSGEHLPFTWSKCVHIDWYSHPNARISIQSTRLRVERLGERAFELTEEEWLEQCKRNAEEAMFMMTRFQDALDQRPPNNQDEDEDS